MRRVWSGLLKGQGQMVKLAQRWCSYYSLNSNCAHIQKIYRTVHICQFQQNQTAQSRQTKPNYGMWQRLGRNPKRVPKGASLSDIWWTIGLSMRDAGILKQIHNWSYSKIYQSPFHTKICWLKSNRRANCWEAASIKIPTLLLSGGSGWGLQWICSCISLYVQYSSSEFEGWGISYSEVEYVVGPSGWLDTWLVIPTQPRYCICTISKCTADHYCNISISLTCKHKLHDFYVENILSVRKTDV